MDAILFSARPEAVKNAIMHLNNHEELYWGTKFRIKKKGPILGFIHMNRSGTLAEYRVMINKIIPFDPAHYDQPDVKPEPWRQAWKDNIDRSGWKHELVMTCIAPYAATSLKKSDGESVKGPPRGGTYIQVSIPDQLKEEAAFEEDAEREVDRLKMLRERAMRPKQRQFSAMLRQNYQGRCAITRCNTSAALEAAHIRIQKGRDDNSPENGLLLRSDIHALFDNLLITLSADGARVEVSDALTDPSYEFLRNAPVSRPKAHPSPENIRNHRKRFSEKSRPL